MPDVILRPAVLADAAGIRRMIREERLNPFSLDWRRFIIAEDKNRSMVACVQVKPHRDGTRELASLVVLPQVRGQGLARMLIETVLARENGTLYLTCRDSLIPLYARFGFKSLSSYEHELPPYFRRLEWVFRLFKRITHVSENLAIMRKDGEIWPEV
jgi:amino-acid N-acetyltransferase